MILVDQRETKFDKIKISVWQDLWFQNIDIGWSQILVKLILGVQSIQTKEHHYK